MSKPVLEEVAGYVGFGPDDAKLLAELGPLLRPRFEPIVDQFYDAIAAHPGASEVITGGDAQIARLKGTLVQWLEGVFGGVYDEDYVARRFRIGRVHVRIGLDQRYMFSAMNLIREGLHLALDEAEADPSDWPSERRRRGHAAIDRICDIELAIMLESYREAYVTRIRGTERLATLGQLAASIGHDLRNPLAVIETSLHLMRRKAGGQPQVDRHLGRIQDQVNLAGAIISDLLELARDREPERTPTDLALLVREVLASLPRKEEVEVAVIAPESLAPVSVDGGQMRQVVVNLLMNAIQAVRSSSDANRVWVRLEEEPAHTTLVVEDEGPGIAPEARERLFEPLFTTRAKGIGLGLALCKRIVDKHGGALLAGDRPGGGARFEVRLPVGKANRGDVS